MNHLTSTYLQSGCLSVFDKLLTLIHSDLPYYFNATKACKAFNQESGHTHTGNSIYIDIPLYQGNNKTVLKIRDYIDENMSADVMAAYLHGSTGTNELIPYSDFDGILILKDDCLSNINRIKRTALEIQDTYGMMLQLDPLQHHGWFLFSESDLMHFDDTSFPVELFRHASTLFGSPSIQVTIDTAKFDYAKSFFTMSKTLLNRTSEKCPVTLFEVKILLSELMLLPALFVQAVEKKGIFKKESFPAAAKFFTSDEWQIMNEISSIRMNWNYNLHRKSECIAWKYRRIPLIAQIMHGNTPVSLRNKLENELFEKMQHLIQLMQKKINA